MLPAQAIEERYWVTWGWYWGNGGIISPDFLRYSYDSQELAKRFYAYYGRELAFCNPTPDWLNTDPWVGGFLCLDKQTLDLYGQPPSRLNDYILIRARVCSGRLTSQGGQRGDPIEWFCVEDSAANSSSTVLPEKNVGRPQLCVGNPVSPANGNKFQIEQDYVSGRELSFVRYYDSKLQGSARFALPKIIGVNWRHNFDKKIYQYQDSSGVTSMVWSAREDGKFFRFVLINGKWVPDKDVNDQLEQTIETDGKVTGWKYTYGINKEDSFNSDGILVTSGTRNGYKQYLTYSDTTTPENVAPYAGLLIDVTDSFGQKIRFTYDAKGRISTMADASGSLYKYDYDNGDNLLSVTYPDSSVRKYLYEDTTFPNALSGIIDENGTRFASWSYDARGRAISSEHAGGTEKTTLTYADTSSKVTDASNTERTYNFETILGVVRSKGQSQPGGSGCSPASSAMTYDANGNVASSTDFNGNVTTYTYDLNRNLETRRVEAPGTAQERAITTEWHPTYRLRTRIAEPKRITTNTYDSNGNLLTKNVQTTTDNNGAQGFSAIVTGAPRIWSYTYNAYDQILTITGPRKDVVDKTSYTYDSQGNLAIITNALGHVITLSNYDANGRVGRIIDANGLITDLSYSQRGWLTSRSVSGEITNFDYYHVGQLKKITLHDGSAISYTYDDAHRLSDVADSLGNSIHYTLDAMGNRVKEEIKDSNGMLARQITRVYDALNRLQQITGALQ